MPLANAKAAVAVEHAHGQLAFAHDSNAEGARVALDSGVDDALLAALVARHVAMIPTLKMFATTVTTNPAYLDPIYAQVRGFHELDGELLFGTSIGCMTDYTTAGELWKTAVTEPVADASASGSCLTFRVSRTAGDHWTVVMDVHAPDSPAFSGVMLGSL